MELSRLFELNQDGLFLCLFILLGAVLATCLHEFGHAIVAYWGGDRTVKSKGYLTLNPLKYTDVSTSLVLPIVFLLMGGFALPGGAVYINTHLLRGRIWKSAVSAAGPGMTALTALLLSIPFRFDFAIYSYGWFWPALAFLAQIEIAVLLLNLLPIPALDGYGILEPWLPENMQQQLRGVKKYGFLFLLAMFWTSPAFSSWFWGVSFTIAELLGIPSDLSAEGYETFQAYRWLLLVLLVVLAIGNKFLPRDDETDQTKQYWTKQKELNEEKLAQNPSDYEVLKQQGQILIGFQKHQEAEEHYAFALKAYPQDTNFRVNYGLMMACQGKHQDALEEYNKVLEQKPKDHDALLYRAMVFVELGQHQEALEILDSLLSRSPHSAQVWSVRGSILKHFGQDEEALISYKKATQYDDKQDYSWAALAKIQRKLSNFKESELTLKYGLLENPGSVQLWELKLNWLLEAHDYSAVLDACDGYAEALGEDSALPFFFQGIAFGKLQRYSAAIAAFDTALGKDPDATWILISRAQYLVHMKCHEAALEEVAKLLSEDPENRTILEIKAHALLETQEYDGAISLYRHLAASNQLEAEEKARLLSNVGFVLRERGEHQAALEVQKQALEVSPNYEYALSNRGWTLTHLGQVEAGLAEIEQAVQANPSDPLLWKIQGIALQEQEQYELALNSYEQSLKIKPDIEILCDQAICFLRLNDPDSAAQALQKARDLHEPTTLRTVAEKPELATFFQQHYAPTTE